MDADDAEKRITDLEHQLAGRQRGADVPTGQPDLLFLLKMIAPSRGAKILLGLSVLLDVAGFLILIIAASHVNSHPTPLSLYIIAAALLSLSTVTQACLVIAGARRQSKRRQVW